MTDDRRKRFDELIVPELDFLARIARTLSSSAAQADDLAQETLLKAFRAMDSFDGRYARAWLARIARNTAMNRDQRNREIPVGDEMSLEADPVTQAFGVMNDDPASIVVDQQLDGLLVNALQALPDDFRLVIQLVDVEQMKYQQAAQALDIPVGTVMSRLHRGRARLREAIKGSHLDRRTS